jgi:phosphate acetyltransferase
MTFEEMIQDKARQHPKCLVLPEGEDPRILKAARFLYDQKIAGSIILAGNPDIIRETSNREGISLDKIEIENPGKTACFDEYCHTYYELRKHKGISEEEAKKAMLNPVNWGTMMVKMNRADTMVAGAANPTARVMKAALTIIKTKPGVKIASSFFIMHHPDINWGTDGCFIFSDCALNPDPVASELVEIAAASAQACRLLLNVKPCVALLSFSTKSSAKHPKLDKIQEACRILKERKLDFIFDGELQLDAALVPEVAKQKAPDSPVKGRANVLIFPDLNAGNIGYKLVQRFGNTKAYGPLLQGLVKPISDLSRGCTTNDIINSSAAALVLSQKSGN